ncbi:hypothetical protein CR51_41405 [Caballeronia megalochromosomata]|nr:hypothetical protein CR51_41405 [Caballeronia megalochromosomata]
MNGDFSRWPFDPERDYRGVRLQQGRPLGDWDWNELVEESSRLAQATALDTFGGAAVVPNNTHDAFALSWSGPTLLIGRGRIYVDGLLAENHGTGADDWDPALAETIGTDPTPYDQQPYLPNPPALPGGGPHLAYLDVWKREVNQYQAPALVEKALGVDTTTRIQTVWQLKVLDLSKAGVPALDCKSAPPQWLQLIAPSAGRLSTLTAKYESDDPCIIPPSGGYTGLENQLYRVEIHEGGAPGKATFKWSRENASVEARVLSFVNATSFIVDSTGKDDFKSFKPGDWIELTDNSLELANQPGTMLRIAAGGVLHDTRKIVVEAPPAPAKLPAGTPDAALCTRIRRWDQTGKILRADTTPPTPLGDVDTGGGLIAVPADNKTAIALDSGIAVSFDVTTPGGEFKAGDYWLFAARSVDASVEVLDHAPPRGIHHHYARIGIIDGGATTSDCRLFWPPEGAQAPPQPPAGSDNCACTVCVSPEKAGTLQDVIATLRQKGKGGTICLEAGDYELDRTIVIPPGNPLILRGQGDATRLITKSPFGFVVIGSQNVVFERFAMQAIVRPARDDAAPSGAAILLYDSRSIRIDDLSFDALPVEEGAPLPARFAAIACATSPVGAPDKAMLAASALDDIKVSHCRLRTPTGIICLALTDPAANAAEALKRLQAGGVAALGEGPVNLNAFDIDDNQFACGARAVVLQSTNDCRPLVHVQRNSIAGSADGAVSITGSGKSEAFARTSTAYGEIAGNTVDQCGLAVSLMGYDGGSFDIVGNTFTQCSAPSGAQCVQAQWLQAVTIADNNLDFIGQGPKTGAMSAVLTDACLTVQISRNRMFNIGPATLPDIAGTKVTAIAIGRALGAVDISGNLVTQGYTGASEAGDDPAWCGIHIVGIGRKAGGPAVAATSPCAANLHSNQIGAQLNAMAARVENIDTCHYCNNQSMIWRRTERTPYADVMIDALSLIVNNNTIKGSSLSAVLTNQAAGDGLGAVIGNVSTGAIKMTNGTFAGGLNFTTTF